MGKLRNLSIAALVTAAAAFSVGAGATPISSSDCTADQYLAQSLSGSATSFTSAPVDGSMIMRFVNVSDTHITDDEASTVMNGSWLETLLEPAIGNGSAQRLQEEYTDEVLDALETTINECNQEQALELMIATGDLTDNMTLNELRRYIDNLDGTSGAPTAFEGNCGYRTRDPLGRPRAGLACTQEMKQAVELMTGRLVPDAPTTEPDPESAAYQFTPTRSAIQIVDTYAQSQINGSHHVAPGLPEQLRCSYAESGCANSRLEVPHYAVFGNHDGSVRGTLTMQRPFNAGTAAFGRYFLESQREFINEWFATTQAPGPVGHGFNHVDPSRFTDQNDRNDGYYAFDAGLNGSVKMIVLNTIFDGVRSELHRDGQTSTQTQGLVAGNEVTPAPATSEQGFMDQAQYDWLQGQLQQAQGADQAILVFSHHPDRSFSYAQYGSKLAEELNRLLGSYPNVVAHIAGHTHENIINKCAPNNCLLKGSQLSGIQHGFWRIETSSLIDFPQESRIIELYRLPSGEFAIRSTMITADRHDAVSDLSYRLSVAEADCKTSHLVGGPLWSGPYDRARLEKALYNAGEAAQRSKFCLEGIDKSAGDPDDRDTLMLP